MKLEKFQLFTNDVHSMSKEVLNTISSNNVCGTTYLELFKKMVLPLSAFKLLEAFIS